MQVYIALDGETLRIIASKLRIELEQLMSLNPDITDPDRTIAGQRVNYLNLTDIPVCFPPPPTTDQKHWIPLTPLEEMEKTDYDVLIVGTGAGGGAALWRLCDKWARSGRRIGVVEQGDLLLPTHSFNVATMNAQRKHNFFWNNVKPLGKFLPDFPGAMQLFALGGRTLFWWAVTPRMHPVDIAQWPVTFDEMEPYYNIAEGVLNVSRLYSQGSKVTEILLTRLRERSFPDVIEQPMAVDLSETKFGQLRANPFFSSIVFLATALNRHPFDLAVQARATRVLSEHGRAVGIEVMTPEMKSYVLRARTVVLSGSTWETPRLLLYSGIEGRAIGQYLMNHSKIFARAKVKRTDFPEVLGTLSILIPRADNRPYQIQIMGPHFERFYWHQPYDVEPLLPEVGFEIHSFGVVEPRYENRMFLDPTRADAYGVPEIQVNFSYSERDKAVIRELADAVKQAVHDMGASFVLNNGEPDLCLRVPGDDTHEVGTCRMGDDPSTSATNRFGQIHGIPNLYVADNSVLPTSGAANPTLTTIALAIRTADHIIHQLR
ncbi:GMC oxidoreductase [Effusibacillus consociatus]|uniref:GMC oxidoreductase n=1 Tax=Effusibacillus consociatus TaxID=1117041 RepID=A0ABV9Q5I3_9BACL